MVSAFRASLDGMVTRLGLFDVVLPFLLVFAIVFAALEKSRVLGVLKVDSVEYSKKNLNAIVALSIALLTVASSKLVGIIIGFSTTSVILILFAIGVLMVAGLFFKDGEVFDNIIRWKSFFVWSVFVVLLLVLFAVLGWIEPVFRWIGLHWHDSYGSAVLLTVVIIGSMFYITSNGPKPKKTKEGE